MAILNKIKAIPICFFHLPFKVTLNQKKQGERMKGLISLNNYLGKTNLTEHLQLTDSVSFHWANWDQTCLLQQQYYKQYNNNLNLFALNCTLQDLKLKTVWLCNKVEVLRTDLYAVYESYLDSRLRLTWLERKDEILYSMDSEQGPYFTLTSMKWFNKDIYAQFVMRKILVEQFTLRSFRLNTSIPVALKFDNDVTVYDEKVCIHQISEAGVILKIKDKNFVNKIKNSHTLEFKIPVSGYHNTQRLSFHDSWKKLDSDSVLHKEEQYRSYQLDSRILNFYGNLTNAKRSGDNEFYIFARYADLMAMGHSIPLSDAFAPLVSKTKKYFLKEIEVLAPQKIVA